MKIAIVHDSLVIRGGAEKVALAFAEAFPGADFYTLCYNPDDTYPEFSRYVIRTSVFQMLSNSEKGMKRLFFPFGVAAMSLLHLKGYDVVLMSSTNCAKYVRVGRDTVVINYCHSPFRLAWEPESYPTYVTASPFHRLAMNAVIQVLRRIDRHFARKDHHYITNSTNRAELIRRVYAPNRDIRLLFPPVDLEQFPPQDLPRSYFLVVSRLEGYKRVDLVIDAFNRLGLPLVVVGNGTQEKKLQAIASKHITFRKNLSNLELSEVYSQARALIFPQVEDFGITPIEANAAGTPVIAFGKGGVLHTQIPFDGTNAGECTSLFFFEQTVESLMAVVQLFDAQAFDSNFLREHAKTFSKETFKKNIIRLVNTTWLESTCVKTPLEISDEA
jgi:glycosyltransferase involved in cell wall biosynthesis